MKTKKPKTTPKNLSISDLAREFRCDRATVRKYLEAAGLEPVSYTATTKNYDAEMARKAVEAGLSSGRGPGGELRASKLREEIRKLKIANDEREGKLVSREAVRSAMFAIANEIKPLLEAKLENEYPSVVAQLEPAQARVYGRRLNAEVLGIFQKAGRHWDNL